MISFLTAKAAMQPYASGEGNLADLGAGGKSWDCPAKAGVDTGFRKNIMLQQAARAG
jgi:hypothetical protein